MHPWGPPDNQLSNRSTLLNFTYSFDFQLTRCDEDVPDGEAAAVVGDDLSDAQRQAVPPEVGGQGESGGLAGDDSLRWGGG